MGPLAVIWHQAARPQDGVAAADYGMSLVGWSIIPNAPIRAVLADAVGRVHVAPAADIQFVDEAVAASVKLANAALSSR